MVEKTFKPPKIYLFAVVLFDPLLKVDNLLVLRSPSSTFLAALKIICCLRTINFLTYNLSSDLLPLAHP